MTITLGEALTGQDDSNIDLEHAPVEEGIDKARQELSKEEKVDVAMVRGALKKAMLAALDIGLDDILGQAWSGWPEIRKYADPSQTPPDDVNVVPVGSHTIESIHEPSVDVVVGGVKVHTFPFHVAAQLDVQGANLVVQAGKIKEIQVGSIRVGGAVKLRDRTLVQKNVAEVQLPGSFKLTKPISILPG